MKKSLKNSIKNLKKEQENLIRDIFELFPTFQSFQVQNWSGPSVIDEINEEDFPMNYDHWTELAEEAGEDAEEDEDIQSWLVENNMTVQDVITLAEAVDLIGLPEFDSEVKFQRKDYV